MMVNLKQENHPLTSTKEACVKLVLRVSPKVHGLVKHTFKFCQIYMYAVQLCQVPIQIKDWIFGRNDIKKTVLS